MVRFQPVCSEFTFSIHAEAILRLLYDHIDKSADNQARVKWDPNTVVIWDNRITAHVRVPPFRTVGDAYGD